VVGIPGLDPGKINIQAIHTDNFVEFSGGGDLF
jgi:hypothetical protein